MYDLNNVDIDKFIERASKMNFIDLYAFCQGQCKWLDARRVSRKREDQGNEYKIRQFNDFISGFTFMLHGNALKPASMEQHDFVKTKRVFEALIEKGQWKKEWLEIYN